MTETDLDSAALIEWNSIDFFSPSEFPEGALEHLEDDFLYALNEFRRALGHPVTPSPLKDGWFRLTDSTTSRHYAVDRLSDAGDVFPHCDIREAMMVALSCGHWGGIGIYLDTNGPDGSPMPMMHLDLREGLQIWMRYEGQYIYPNRSPSEFKRFWKLLGELE